MNGKISIAISLVLLVVVGGFIVWFKKDKDLLQDFVQRGIKCLQEGEIVEYEIEDKREKNEPSTITIRVMSSGTNETISEFIETILQPGHYYPAEVHECNVYFVRGVNYDPATNYKKEGFKGELWKYSYDGIGQPILLLEENPGEYVQYYTRDFRVDSSENFIVLRSISLDPPEDKLIIKDIETARDLFTITFTELYQQNKNAAGDFRFDTWSNDSRYFWSRLSEAAYTNGWVRIDTSDWSYELYEAPDGVLGGYSLNINTGWIPVIPGAFWTGADIFDEQVKQQREAEGSTADLYLYNVITQERILIDDTDAPIWRGLEAVWLNDQTLEYTHPGGERKQYTISN